MLQITGSVAVPASATLLITGQHVVHISTPEKCHRGTINDLIDRPDNELFKKFALQIILYTTCSRHIMQLICVYA